MSNITLNIVEPGSPTPDPVVPNTGLFTHGIGSSEATIIAVSTILLLAIVALVVFAILHKKKTGKSLIRNNKHITTAVILLAILTSAGTFIALARNAALAADTDEEANDETGLTVDVSSTELTIEVADEPVFAVLPVDVTVEEATLAGYTLTAYTDNTSLVSTTDSSKVIPMVAAEGNELTVLTTNTYGLSLVEPKTKDDEVYTALSTDPSTPTVLKATDYTETEANDTTTIYYGFYITPDVPYGTYTNDGEVYYNATINTTPVTFDGKGLYFDEEQTQSTNTVEYIAVSQENNETETSSTINQPISGEYKTPSQALPYIFLGWSTDPTATEPTYTSAEDIAQNLPILPNQPIILYAIWQKATTITFDANDGTGTMQNQTIIAGESDNLYENTFTREGYTFTGWNIEAEPTEQEPGKAYEDQAEYTAPADSGYVTLYAQWKQVFYMQDVAIWGSTLSQGDTIEAVDSRDGKSYWVAKLADGDIWMTQNLDFDIVKGGADLDHTNTDVPANWADAGHLVNTYTTGTTTWNRSTTAPESYDPGNLYWNGNLNSSYNGTLSNMTVTNPPATYGGTHYHIGNYYNWTAAVAMSNSSSYTSGDVDQSICPAGWKLPNLSDNKSYQNLVDTLGLSAGSSGNIQNSPVYFVYGGGWSGISYSVGSYGFYWSSVINDSSYAYRLFFDVDGNLGPQDDTTRNGGYSLRCVAR